MVPPPVEEENSDLFYKPYNFATEDKADMLYQPYKKPNIHEDYDAEKYYLSYIPDWNQMSDPWLQYYDNTPLPTHSKTQKYEGPFPSVSMELFEGPFQTLGEVPQYQELPKLSLGNTYTGPNDNIADVKDNEIFDVPKVLIKTFKKIE